MTDLEPVVFDRKTMTDQEIDALIKRYAPHSHDIDVAIQNMGLRIAQLEGALPPAVGDQPELPELVSLPPWEDAPEWACFTATGAGATPGSARPSAR